VTRGGSGDVSDVSRRLAASVHVLAWLTSVECMLPITAWAEDLARTLLAGTLPRRWSHVQGVAARARALAPSLGADAELIEAAAWLHDIGYLPELADTGLHGLDGARYLRDVQHAGPLLCRLVAHHSCAVIEAEERGLAYVLTGEFAPPPRPLADALTFCDMTTSPDGEHVQVNHRLAEIHDRYGSAHLVSRSIRRATPFILEAVGNVSARAALGLTRMSSGRHPLGEQVAHCTRLAAEQVAEEWVDSREPFLPSR
jgi:HD domain